MVATEVGKYWQLGKRDFLSCQICQAQNPVRLNLVASFVSRAIWHFHLAIAAHVTHRPLTHVDATIGEAVCPFTIHPESKQTPNCTSTVRTLYKSLQTPSSICKLHMLHDESALMTMTSGRSFFHLQSSEIA